jgi:superfamily II DNA or RNA helicase
VAVPDFSYSYAESIQDDPQVCRHVYFPSFEGNMEWLSGDDIYKASFSDELNEKQESERLRTALWSDDWVRPKLIAAKEKLHSIRANHADAGGLIVAMNQQHAEFLAEMMRDISMSRPLVIASDDKDAHSKLNAFKHGVEPWVIAIKMISEGVDIPRLRVCSYMSNIVTEMFFRQVVGRIIRFSPRIEYQESYMFIPADRRLTEMAKAMRDERIQATLQQDQDGGSERGEGGCSLGVGLFRPLSADARASDTITFDGESYTAEKIAFARKYAAEIGIATEKMAKMIRLGWRNNEIEHQNGSDGHASVAAEPAYQRLRKQRTNKKTKNLKSDIRARWLSHIENDNEAYRAINRALNSVIGKRAGEKYTEEQYKRVNQLLETAVQSMERPSWL